MTSSTSNAWQQLLEQQGFNRDAHGELQRGQPQDSAALQASAALMPLEQLCVLEIHGPDGEKFLQGQTSASTAHATEHVGPPTVFCTPKGRTIANAQLIHPGEERWWLLLARSVAEPLRQHLGKYIPFYKAEIALRDDLALFGVAGAEGGTLLESDGLPLPRQQWGVRLAGDSVITRHPHQQPRFLLAAPVESAGTRYARLAEGALQTSEALWTRLDIQAGLLWLDGDQTEAWLPQMFNWEALAGISFKKGCYTGQEVVARAHYRGQVKKRLMHLSVALETAPAAGTAVIDAERGKSVGEVMRAAAPEDGRVELLAILTIKDEMPSLTIDDQPAHLSPLPYALARLDPETLEG
ncbi:CAF17-like 4Fe-4S cluster assembly/insertion protein YgfZ [Kushneria aurantia]|uniref:YgfZ/GcvT domain-containing protein n=1 Tax=Kushneria aurantia TaxID=504092 RepID=A0ABV6G641_9GAMM|nr:folate-binding protein YgfZ [Kushneria aurantia]